MLCTHAHDDHVTAAVQLAEATGAPVYLHPDDRMLWDRVHVRPPDAELSDGQTFRVGDVEVEVRQTPGHSPGACCFHVPALGLVFTGDTLFQGGPGATGRSFSDFGTIIESLRGRLLTLPPRPSSTPVMATRRRSATRLRTCRSGSTEVPDRRHRPASDERRADLAGGLVQGASDRTRDDPGVAQTAGLDARDPLQPPRQFADDIVVKSEVLDWRRGAPVVVRTLE